MMAIHIRTVKTAAFAGDITIKYKFIYIHTHKACDFRMCAILSEVTVESLLTRWLRRIIRSAEEKFRNMPQDVDPDSVVLHFARVRYKMILNENNFSLVH